MKKPYSDRIRKNILALARRKGLTIEKVAVESDMSKSFLSEVISGRSSISLNKLKHLAEALDVDIVDLLKP